VSLLDGWDQLRHGGLLLDTQRLGVLVDHEVAPPSRWLEGELRRRLGKLIDSDAAETGGFVQFVLTELCRFSSDAGTWLRGSAVPSEWGYAALTGETIKPRHLWKDSAGGVLPVFIDREKRIGIGRGRKLASHVLQWLRRAEQPLALVTNARQWRLVFAGLDFDAWCEWDTDLWLEEGRLSAQVTALRTLLQPALWRAAAKDTPSLLTQAVQDSRKGQAELSRVLGERVREAVEMLVQGHGDALKQDAGDCDPADIYRAAVRVVMRLVVILFAESRELLPRENAYYHGAYGLNGLLEQLERQAARAGARLARTHSAWPRVLALFRLVRDGAHHPDLLVPAYGGELFAAGERDSADGLSRALAVFERACFDTELLSDREVHKILERLTRTRVRVRQGRAATWVPAPVDFSDLSSEYIGILYEGLLDFELRTAPPTDPVIFLALGNQPALPLSRLEGMDDRQLKELLEKMKDTSSKDDEEADASDEAEAEPEADAQLEEAAEEEPDEAEADEAPEEIECEDVRHTTRGRAETWARRAVEAGKLVKRPTGTLTPERRMRFEEQVSRKARQLVSRVVLPGEWYLVRWGGTRKGSGTFYTRPGLSVPTVQRTLRPLAYEALPGDNGQPDEGAPPSAWLPRRPEEILALKVLDPGCGSGSFPVAALRFLTEALYASLHHHERIRTDGDRSVIALLAGAGEHAGEERLREELLPCRPDDPLFEARLKAVLRRHVVERCIYGVDLDPLAAELCRLALWVETLDRNLPFSFLDHKIKCGNALVGAWFDQFRHYPVMAWKNREGGDKGHSNGVFFAKEARGKAIKAFVSEVLGPDLQLFLRGRDLLQARDLQVEAGVVHDAAFSTLVELHELPVHDAAERARRYRERLLDSAAYQLLKGAMDLWCACWFWPADDLDDAPVPSTFHQPSDATRAIATQIAAAKRFFHWELEFPDVFRQPGSGFDAVVGNPPWDIAKPNSKEYFSNIDPLYRAYGKQEALGRQAEYFADEGVERGWLDYNADFRAQSNFMKYAANAFGDPDVSEASGDRFAIGRGAANLGLHERWRNARAGGGYADPRHPFRHQGSADINLYKLFLEQAHALLREGGRIGFVVPSGLYSDHGTGALRTLFLDHCQWEWLFGFENREGIFEIHRSYKFNPVIIQKGRETRAIHTAFMRRKLEDWVHAERHCTDYSRERVTQFSPRSNAILEIQSARDLEILEKIYADSVLLGDDGPDGWGIKYRTDFHMTNDSRLFPPRPKWEERGYRPDEYSRWLKGEWQPIAELWAELGVDPARPQPVDIDLEDWLFETGVSPEDREARKQFVHGHLLKPGDMQRTEWRLRCAQPPYDSLPIPRADIPEGIILSRTADAWIREQAVEDIALPVYSAKAFELFDFSTKGWVSGKGRSAVWEQVSDEKPICPEYLMHNSEFAFEVGAINHWCRLLFKDISTAVHQRTLLSAIAPWYPAVNAAPVLLPERAADTFPVQWQLGSFALDFVARLRIGYLHLNYFVIQELPLISPRAISNRVAARIGEIVVRLSLNNQVFAATGLRSFSVGNGPWKSQWALLERSERLRYRCMLDAIAFTMFGLESSDLDYVLKNTDLPIAAFSSDEAELLPPKGFWRVDKNFEPELRHSVLMRCAFEDLQKIVSKCDGDVEAAIIDFCDQNQGQGWALPDLLRLADYGIGHDARAVEHQLVATLLGPRFYDWQLSQTVEESWNECNLHARNQLGRRAYEQLCRDIERGDEDVCATSPDRVAEADVTYKSHDQGKLF
jgi:hypothetical protein